MEKRKNPEKDLRDKSGLFFQIGLLTTMMLIVSAFEYRSKDAVVTVPELGTNVLDEPPIPITVIDPPPPPPKPILLNPVVADPDEPEIELPDLLIDPELIPDIPEPLLEPLPDDPPTGPVDYAEVMPSFEGGYEGFYKFVSKKMKYPRKAKSLGIDGKVFVQFVIDEEGKVTDVKAIKGIGAGLDEEAVRVLSQSPNWSPGRQGGRRVKVRMVIPIIFRLH